MGTMMRATQTSTYETTLTRTLSQAMRIFRSQCPQEVNSYAGYFHLPISVQGQPYDLPLGFLGTLGCSWAKEGGCTMCNYGGFASSPSNQELIDQAEYLVKSWEDEGPLKEVNLSALGSFFDEKELPAEAREGVLKRVASRKTIDLLGVESRPEFITAEKIEGAKTILGPQVRIEVGMGLESSDEFMRNVCINKDLSEEAYLRAVECLKDFDVGVTTHILFKPPFLTEEEAIDDAVASINYAHEKGADRIVLMVSNVKKYTLTSWLMERGLYRVPALWSVLRVALEINEEARKKLLIYGFKCGMTLLDQGRNCPVCTAAILNKIDLFNYTGNARHLQKGLYYGCKCKEVWAHQLSHDDPSSVPLSQRVVTVCELLWKDVLKYGQVLED